jgi:hypothetical protein
MAMAGFVSNLNIFILVTLLGEKRKVFDVKWAFIAWQAGTLGYVMIMFIAGWLEGGNHAFSVTPGAMRDVIYLLRLGCGALMTAAACHWLVRITRSLQTKHSNNPRTLDRAQDDFQCSPSEGKVSLLSDPDLPSHEDRTVAGTAIEITWQIEQVQFYPRVELVTPTPQGRGRC